MSIPKGDFIGFTFNGIHSSELGIVRTSDGSRFNESLLPTAQDKVVQVPGGDGSYYFGSYYTQRQFPVSFAFDSLTEEQLRKIKQLFGDKKIHPLIFDEMPYKEFQVKVTGSATIKHIPFREGATQRIYKGEGQIQFTAYQPYGRAPHKFLNEYNVSNKQEWAKASGMKSIQGDYDKRNGIFIPVFNPGDVPTDWILECPFKEGADGQFYIPAGSLLLQEGQTTLGSFTFNKVLRKGQDTKVKINSKNNLIEGYYLIEGKERKSGNIYNEYIVDGAFFRIPPILSEQGKFIVNSHTVEDKVSDILSVSPLTYTYYYL